MIFKSSSLVLNSCFNISAKLLPSVFINFSDGFLSACSGRPIVCAFKFKNCQLRIKLVRTILYSSSLYFNSINSGVNGDLPSNFFLPIKKLGVSSQFQVYSFLIFLLYPTDFSMNQYHYIYF